MENNSLKFIDFHCHYDEIELKELKNTFPKNQVALSAAVSYNSCKKHDLIKEEKIPNLYFAYGFYPDVVLKQSLEECLEELKKVNFENAIAIGEIGLDNKITKDKTKRKEQEILFLKQIKIAKKLDYPIVVHSRYATKKVLDLLTTIDHNKVILHWFSGLSSEIKTALDRGYYLTTRFGRPHIHNLKEHLNQIFIETDFPVSYNGEPLKIDDIKLSYEVLAKENNIDLNYLKEKIQNNFLNLFPSINI